MSKVIGSFEYVALPELGVEQVLAKVDTGAYSGAMHCESVVLDGDVLKFKPLNTGRVVETTDYQLKLVRSASGHEETRYAINTSIELAGERYTMVIGLTDRSDMQYDMLLGRRFLRMHDLVADTRINQDLDYERKRELDEDSDTQ